jgi:DNA-binding transcriptional LysR family regulator
MIASNIHAFWESRLMQIDLRSLQLFVAVVESGSLHAASKREHVAMSALSKRIALLEERIGTQLLVRSSRGVEVTLAGRALVEGGRGLLHNMQDLENLMSDFTEGIRGTVRLAVPMSVIMQFLPESLLAFNALYPGIDIKLNEISSDLVVESVANSNADIGIYVDADGAQGLATFPYHRHRLDLVVPVRHSLAGLSEIAFNETLGFDYIGLYQNDSLHRLFRRVARTNGVVWRLQYQVASFESLVSMVRAGLGIGTVPSTAADAIYKHLPDLVLLRLTDEWAQRSSQICVRSVEALSTAAKLLFNHLRGGNSSPPPVL